MRISGNLREFSFLLRLGMQMKGEFLYFAPGGDYWLVYDGGRALYVQSKLDISHHIAIGMPAIHRIYGLINRIRRNQIQHKDIESNRLNHYFVLLEESFQVSTDEEAIVQVHSGMEQLEMFGMGAKRFANMKTANETDGAPYIKLDHTFIHRYTKDVIRYFRDYKANWNFETDFFITEDDETKNLFQVNDDGELVVIREGKERIKVPERAFVYTDLWFVPERHTEYTFYLSDTDLRMMNIVSMYEHIEEFRVTLFKRHYVIDAYDDKLLFKIFLNRKKSAL